MDMPVAPRPEHFDPLSQGHKANPFPFFANLRDRAPVFRAVVPMLGPVWLLSRYDDVVRTSASSRIPETPA